MVQPYERALLDSIERFVPVPGEVKSEATRFYTVGLPSILGNLATPPAHPGEGHLVFRRNPEVKGPMSVFGYDYFTDHYGEERARQVRLLRYQGLWGSGGDYAYEVLNFVDGTRTAHHIRDAVSAIYGPIPLDVVLEYLRALESIGVLRLAES